MPEDTIGKDVDGMNARRGVWGKATAMYLLMFSYAIFTTMIGAQLPTLVKEFAISLSDGGIFAVLMSAGNLLGILVSGIVLDRYRVNRLILLSYIAFTLALCTVIFSASYVSFLCLVALIGFGAKFLDAALNTGVSQLDPAKRGFYINLLHCSFGIGSFLGPLLTSLLMRWGVAWRYTYLYLGLLCAVLCVWYAYAARLRQPDQPEHVRERTVTPFRAVLQPRVFLLMLILISYCGHQAGVNNWLPTYLEQELHADPVTASLGVSIFWIGLILSRLIGSFLVQRIRIKKLLLWGFLLGAVLFGAGVIGKSVTVLFIGAAAAGLFAGASIPMLLTLGYSWFPNAQGKMSMLMFVSICLGSMIMPWLMGIIAGAWGLQATMIANVASLGAACLLALTLKE